MHSQPTLTNQRVQTLVNSNGDTLIQMNLVDAKIILNDLLDKEIADSLIDVYVKRDSVFKSTISFQVTEIKLLQQKSQNQELQAFNLTRIVDNKDQEISLLNETIKKQKKEIVKQKVLKVIGFAAAVILPITTVILMSQ